MTEFTALGVSINNLIFVFAGTFPLHYDFGLGQLGKLGQDGLIVYIQMLHAKNGGYLAIGVRSVQIMHEVGVTDQNLHPCFEISGHGLAK